MDIQATQHDSSGFNSEFGKTWIYPTNLPIRKYQKEIVSQALFQNTMVCLPTGLGKTFIAAVVMYNYYRWFPSGKVIFMATTKPLVKQQVDACYKIVAMPKECTIELTGTVLKTNRQPLWQSKRVFFLTPQVLLNDLDGIPELGAKIKCIVIDEAHRARGNHAYCEVIKKLVTLNAQFRVLALTATPASSMEEVINICNTLLVSNLEIRTEESPDVTPYLYHKSFQTIVLKLDGKLHEVIEQYKRILDKYVRILINHNAISTGFNAIHKGRLFYLSKEYQEKNSYKRGTEEFTMIVKVFGTCTILYHAYDVLVRHGMRGFAKYYEENINKPLLFACRAEIEEILTTINEYVGPPLIYEKLPSGINIKVPENCKFGHPKFYKLIEVIKEHFNQANSDSSKVIIFCEYRESCIEAFASLLGIQNVKPKMFMGQSSITQKEQVNTIESFRSGDFNTLISTCIGEEGIDVGFVDMVLCFDISNKSSIRFIQRIGRTGRDRNGKVVILVSEGREQQVLKECLHEKQQLCNSLVSDYATKNFKQRLYKHSPKMIPENVQPQCQELFITSKEKPLFFKNVKASKQEESLKPSKQKESLVRISSFIPQSKFISLTSSNRDLDDTGCLNFSRVAIRQRTIQNVNAGTSKDSQILTSLMKLVEYKRFNIKVVPSSQTNEKFCRPQRKKQIDIRDMFKQSFICSKSNSIDFDSSKRSSDLIKNKINSLIVNLKDCSLCPKFDNLIRIKKELVRIENFEFNLDLSCINANSINELLLNHKYKEKTFLFEDINTKHTNRSYDDDFNDDITNEFMSSFDDFDSVSIAKVPSSKLEKSLRNTNNSIPPESPNLSDDLFEESFDNNFVRKPNEISVYVNEESISSNMNKTWQDFHSVSSSKPSNFDLDKQLINCKETIGLINHKTPEKLNNQSLTSKISSKTNYSRADLDEDIIEDSPTERNPKRNLFCSSKRVKKRTKFKLADVFELPLFNKPPCSNTKITNISPLNTKIANISSSNTKFTNISSSNTNISALNTKISSLNTKITNISPSKTEVTNISSSNTKSNKKKKNFQISDIFEKSVLEIFHNPTSCNSPELSSPDLSKYVNPKRPRRKLDVSDIFDVDKLFTTFKKPKLSNENSTINKATFERSDLNINVVSKDPIPSTSKSPSQMFITHTEIDDLQNSPPLRITPVDPSNSPIRNMNKTQVDSSRFPFLLSPKKTPNSQISPLRRSPIIDSPGSPILKPKSYIKPRFLETLIEAKENENKDIEETSLPKSSSSSLSTINSSPPKKRFFNKLKEKKRSGFIDSEAEVDSNDEPSSDEVFSQDPDNYEMSFVDDEVEIGMECSQMQAVYLQSVKSPIKRGKPLFKKPQLPPDLMDTIVHDPDIEETYIKNSFVVGDEEDCIEFCTQGEVSELEKAEMILKQKKKSKNRSKSKRNNFIVFDSSDSSD